LAAGSGGKPQADERDINDEAFGELLVGDTIELAAAALVRGIADFFPKDRRAVLDRLWAATRRTRTEAIQMATDKLDSPLVEQAITGAIRKASDEIDQRLRSFGDTSGNSPESLASSPAP
jgi:acyl-CoA reductase-like NAD-dependent aldehyde dehydrogenase